MVTSLDGTVRLTMGVSPASMPIADSEAKNLVT